MEKRNSAATVRFCFFLPELWKVQFMCWKRIHILLVNMC